MFGSRRKKVTARAIEMARQPLAILQHNHGLPPLFWNDEFVIGYFGSTIGFLSHMLGDGRLSTTDKGFILVDVLTDISNMNGKVIAERLIELANQYLNDSASNNDTNRDLEQTLLFQSCVYMCARCAHILKPVATAKSRRKVLVLTSSSSIT